MSGLWYVFSLSIHLYARFAFREDVACVTKVKSEDIVYSYPFLKGTSVMSFSTPALLLAHKLNQKELLIGLCGAEDKLNPGCMA